MANSAPTETRGVRLSDAQIAGLAKSAGFPDNQIATAVAVALAESSGRIDAVGGPNFNGSYDYGLWQINESAHPEKFRQWPNWWTATNASMAFAVWSEAGKRWTPWSVFNSGAYLMYMPRGTAAAGNPASPGGAGAAGDWKDNIPLVPGGLVDVFETGAEPLVALGNALKTIAASTYKATAWISDSANWVRVAQVGIGVLLLGVALNVVIRPVVTEVAGPALSVLTKGKAKAK